MDPIAVALVSVFGVALSATVSMLISFRVAKIEHRKLNHEMGKVHVQQLLAKRFEVYPPLFELCSTFIKKIRLGTIDRAAVEAVRIEFERLDTQVSLFYSPEAGRTIHAFHWFLVGLCSASESDIAARLTSDESRMRLVVHFCLSS